MNFKRKIITGLATGALLLNSLSGMAFAQADIVISGNGSSSENEVEIKNDQDTTVVQNNDAKITNNITSSTSTGDNDANDNTGGDTLILTGDATSDVRVSNFVNRNVARVEDCGCLLDGKVEISGNGSESENEVEIKNESEIELFQENRADVNNDVDVDTDTGNNNANRNTGGDTTVVTGHATSDVDIENKVNANAARIGPRTNGTGELSALISGNGSSSENEIELESERSVTVVQSNRADVDNDVDADTETGDNDANDNTGGDVLVDTGSARSRVTIDNLLNFNRADVEECCLLDLTAKIAGNGSESESEIEVEAENELEVFQGDNENGGNRADLRNDVDADTETGENDANRNTGPLSITDPVDLITGHATFDARVRNEANANVFTSGGTLPEVSFDFDLSALLAMFGMH